MNAAWAARHAAETKGGGRRRRRYVPQNVKVPPVSTMSRMGPGPYEQLPGDDSVKVEAAEEEATRVAGCSG